MPFFKRLQHALVPTDRRDDAQFNLRIVGREQDIVFIARDKGLANLPPHLGANRNVL